MEHTRQTNFKWVLALPFLLALMSIACGLSNLLAPTRSEANGFPTRTPLPTFTPTPNGASFVDNEIASLQKEVTEPPTQLETDSQETVSDEASELENDASSDPPTPTPEPTATPEPKKNKVTVSILQTMNVRGGPGTNYPIVGPAPAGESARVIGRNADSSWLQVEYPLTADGTGWVYAPLVQVNGNPQAVDIVQIAAPAQPVAAAPPPQPEQEEEPPPKPQYQFTPTGWHASENAAIVQFKGRLRDEAGNLVNGFSVLASNGAFSVVSHPAGASRWYPDKGDGEWDVVMPNLFDAQGWWWLTVVRYECDFDSGFDSQCKQFTRLSEDVKIQVITPPESIINADWVCHWDCNTGLYVDAYRRP